MLAGAQNVQDQAGELTGSALADWWGGSWTLADQGADWKLDGRGLAG